MFQCLPGLLWLLFDKVPEEAKYHPLTRFALMALARKNGTSGAIRCQKHIIIELLWFTLTDNRSYAGH